MSLTERLLDPQGPVAVVIRERLRPVGGKGAVVFPPTYAPDRDQGQKTSGYNIDETRGGKRCTIDSVGSQANRIEEAFLQGEYAALVPQIYIRAGEKTVNVLQAAHRLADAAVRFSELEDEIDGAFTVFAETGNVVPIAKMSPMSVIFGAWDSRGTFAKLPRMFSSTINADDVEVLTRSSQFTPSFTVDDVHEGKSEEDLSEAEQQKWSTVGLAHAPGKGLGGLIVHGKILREGVINLVTLRHLKGGDGKAETARLQEYILALALVSATLPQDYSLRSGCQLVRDGSDALETVLVNRDGSAEAFVLDHSAALKAAKKAAEAFGISSAVREVMFIADKAMEALEGSKAKKAKKKKQASRRRKA